METINNMATAAANAVWPNNNNNNENNANAKGNTNGNTTNGNYNNAAKTNSHDEPISGVTGDTAKGEPYDAGNKDEQDAFRANKSGSNADIDKGFGGAAGGAGASGVSADAAQGGPVQGNVGGNNNASGGSNTGSGAGGAAAAGGSSAGGNDTGTGNAGAAAEQNSKVSSTDGEPKVDGPGPRPINEVAREHGGDAGRAASDDAAGSGKGGLTGGSGDGPQDSSSKAAAAGVGSGGNSGGDDDKPQSESHGEGTGEKYVRSSGLKADGGDFDAANPGAGREAERLLEEKGIHHGDNKASATDDAGADNNAGNKGGDDSHHDGKEKKSLGEKIKAKIHRKSDS